jgi:hypothetical protein
MGVTQRIGSPNKRKMLGHEPLHRYGWSSCSLNRGSAPGSHKPVNSRRRDAAIGRQR